jgi:hypothetical protein
MTPKDQRIQVVQAEIDKCCNEIRSLGTVMWETPELREELERQFRHAVKVATDRAVKKLYSDKRGTADSVFCVKLGGADMQPLRYYEGDMQPLRFYEHCTDGRHKIILDVKFTAEKVAELKCEDRLLMTISKYNATLYQLKLPEKDSIYLPDDTPRFFDLLVDNIYKMLLENRQAIKPPAH